MNLHQVLGTNLFKYASLALVLNIFPVCWAQSQNVTISYLNTDNYPEVEAGFIATTSDGMKIFNSTVDDFSISENNTSSKILEVINPRQQYQPVSIVIMIDISLSMDGRRLSLVKEGLADFIEQLPLETSEVAIACFSDESYIYTDFTQNKNRLISALNRIKNINGTNFNNAFLHPNLGALAIGENAKNKKVVVFVTDGLGTTDAERVADVANQISAQVFAINVFLAIPKDLKALTHKTKGEYFERLTNKNQFRTATTAIFKKLECTDYGIVRWLSKQDCEISKPVQLKYKGVLVELDYDVPAGKVGIVDVNPSLIQFGASKTGVEQVQNLRVTARNIPITLNSFDIDPNSPFQTDSFSFPMQLKSGEAVNARVKFKADEAGLFETNLRVNTAECPETKVKLLAGGEEQIKLIFPRGGEIFIVGEDTSILWEGVKRTQPVDIAYRFSEHDKWQFIDKAGQLRFLWHLPNDTGSKVQVKLTPIKLADENLEISAIIEGGTVPFKNIYFSNDGSRIVTTDQNKFVKSWNPQTGKVINSLGGYEAEKALSPDNDRFFLFLKDETFVWSISTIRITGRISTIGKKVFTSTILPDGSQVLMPANVSTDPAKNARIWSGITDYKAFLINEPNIKWATFTPDGKLTITLNDKNGITIFETDSAKKTGSIQYKETINSIVISPDGSKALLKLPQEIAMVDLLSQQELYRLQQVQFNKFTGEGQFFLTNNRTLVNVSTGKIVTELNNTKVYEISSKSAYLVFNRQDSLYLVNLKSKENILQIPGKPFRLARFSGDESKIYILNLNNNVEIYETATGTFLGIIDNVSRKICDLIINPASPQLALLMDDNRLEIWSPGSNLAMQDAISGKFTIASPKPSVIDTIQFYDQPAGGSKELNIKKFAWNNSRYPLKITNMTISGKDAPEFEILANAFPVRLDAKSQLAQEFIFKPTSIGTKTAVVKTYTAVDSFTTVIIGRGTTQKIIPVIRYFDFGKVKTGSFKDTLVPVLVNTGKEPVIIRNTENLGPDEIQFEIVQKQEFKLTPGDTMKAIIRFIPVTRGKTNTLLTFSPLAEEHKIVLSGEGISPREVIISGTTRNAADSVPVEAWVKKTDLGSNRVMEELTTGTDGKFTLKLLADRNFGITAERENFISTSVNIDLSEKVTADTVYQDIYLTEIKTGAIIRFNCIFFEFNKSTLLGGSQADLNRLLEVIGKYKNHKFEIHGHTDYVGSDTYNINLSKARAEAVMNYLVKNGTPKEQLSIRYFGEKNPVAPNTNDEGRALNRRVELKVME